MWGQNINQLGIPTCLALGNMSDKSMEAWYATLYSDNSYTEPKAKSISTCSSLAKGRTLTERKGKEQKFKTTFLWTSVFKTNQNWAAEFVSHYNTRQTHCHQRKGRVS